MGICLFLAAIEQRQLFVSPNTRNASGFNVSSKGLILIIITRQIHHWYYLQVIIEEYGQSRKQREMLTHLLLKTQGIDFGFIWNGNFKAVNFILPL